MKKVLIANVFLSILSYLTVYGGGDAKTVNLKNIPISVFGGGDALEEKIISTLEGGGDA